MYCEKRQKWTRQYLQDTAVSLKKGDFNTPSVFSFFKKKTAALISQNRRQATVLCQGAWMTSRRNNGFFIIRWAGIATFLFYRIFPFLKQSIMNNTTAPMMIIPKEKISHISNIGSEIYFERVMLIARHNGIANNKENAEAIILRVLNHLKIK